MSMKKKTGSTKKNSQQQQSPGASSSGNKDLNVSMLEGDVSKTRLMELFSMIEKEFDNIQAENATLREKIDTLTERLDMLTVERSTNEGLLVSSGSTTVLPSSDLLPLQHTNTPLKKIKSSGANMISKKLMPGSKKTTSNLKQAECSYGCSYYGHKDGVWHVSYAKNGQSIIGSASADNSACLWDVNNGAMLLKYTGHVGSVNCITFHPSEPLACTASGDSTVHIWKTNVNPGRQIKHDSSGEDKGIPSDDELLDSNDTITTKTPTAVLAKHTGPVMACDWISDGSQLVSASWDHSALLWDMQSCSTIHTLSGHDQELTYVCTHPTQNLVVTSSKDTTFRLWDFRAPPIHSVNVFQGHSKAVTSAVFSLKDEVVSASDDHTIKIWDLHNMRYPVASIRLDCGVNRISVSHDQHVLAVPLDNRHIRLYDLGGNRIANLPHRNRKEHVRMVHCVCWSSDVSLSSHASRCNLFSCGFDARIIGWKVQF